MGRKNIPIPHIPLKFEEAVKEFLKVKPPKKGKAKKKAAPKAKAKEQPQETQPYSAVSNVLKTSKDTKKGSIKNVR